MIPRSHDCTDREDEEAVGAEGLLRAVGAWKDMGDDEIDAMVEEIYRQRRQAKPRPINLDDECPH